MSFNFNPDEILQATQRDSVAFGSSTVSAASTQTRIFSEQEISDLRVAVTGMPEELQTQLLTTVKEKGLTDPQQIAGVIADALSAQQASAPLGNDIMVATPTGLALGTELGVAQAQQEAGRSSFSEADVAQLQSRVESQVKTMMAQGASDDQIQAAVAQFAPGELASIAKDMAQQQLDADKFNMFSSRNNEAANSASVVPVLNLAAATLDTADQNPALQAAKVQHALLEEEARRRAAPILSTGGGYVVSDQPQEIMPAMREPQSPMQQLANSINLSTGKLPVLDMGQAIGPALDSVFAAGPSQTPARDQQRQRESAQLG